MALAITSFTPTTGSTAGGTKVVITGTGLDAVTAVLVGDVQAEIDDSATNTATSLTFLTPAIDNSSSTLTYKVTVFDSATPAEAQSTTDFTYTTVTTPTLSTSLASKWKFQVKNSSGDYIDVRGLTNFTPAMDQTTVDDSDYDSIDTTTGIAYGSDVVTQLKWSLVAEVDRKTASGYVEDPGQKILRLASASAGEDSLVDARWYDRNGGDEAYTGTGIVTWVEKGGATTDKSSVTATVKGRGKRTTITNPAA